ncbi:C40 family peptidase [Streptomyces tendae]|uniref:C40 family peptidase n=1 Tax=Streptomyces tendae TaxID=1932 RepID=UPI0037237F80
MASAVERAARVPVTTVWRVPPEHDPAAAPSLRDLDAAFRRAMVETQVLLGEPVQVVEERRGWSRVHTPWQPSRKAAAGYPGWVASCDLAAPHPAGSHCAVVTSRRSELSGVRTDRRAPFAPWAAVLPVLGIRADVVRVGLPGGDSASIGAATCVVRAAPHPRSSPLRAAELVRTASTMLGVPHVLGGMTEAGLDCSGLVHLACRVLGRTVPRDAEDIAEAGRRIPAAEAAEGDLLFFRRPGAAIHHVGIAVDRPGEMLNTPGGGVTVVEALDHGRLRTLAATATRVASQPLGDLAAG